MYTGSYTLGPSNARLLLRVQREGMAKKVGHDLVFEVQQWSATVNVDAENPGNSTIAASADPLTLEIIEASGGVKPLSDKDRNDVKKNINDKVLKTSQHPEISFQSTGVRPVDATRATVTGDLTIAGATRPAELEVVADGKGGAQASMSVQQTQFGIKPFSALMGALKVQDVIQVQVDVNPPSA
jgi:polyisoprenoid-binding protein YceI